MSSFGSLFKKLELTGVYTLNLSDEVSSELAAFGAALDMVCDELDEAYRESFIDTAQSYGLDRREMIIAGITSSELTPQQRRSIIKQRSLLGESDFTLDALRRLLDAFGVEYNITENPREQRIVIDAELPGFSQAMANVFEQSILEFVPAHLEAEIVYKGKRWSDLDDENLTFTQLDNRDYTWAQLDALY